MIKLEFKTRGKIITRYEVFSTGASSSLGLPNQLQDFMMQFYGEKYLLDTQAHIVLTLLLNFDLDLDLDIDQAGPIFQKVLRLSLSFCTACVWVK